MQVMKDFFHFCMLNVNSQQEYFYKCIDIEHLLIFYLNPSCLNEFTTSNLTCLNLLIKFFDLFNLRLN